MTVGMILIVLAVLMAIGLPVSIAVLVPSLLYLFINDIPIASAIARMSGSGATCFGIFANAALAEQGAARISRAFPDWWVKPTQLGTQSPRAAAQVI